MSQDANSPDNLGTGEQSANGAHAAGGNGQAKALMERGRALAESGDFENAEEAFKQAVAADPTNARA